MTQLKAPCPISESSLWQRQRDYYARLNVGAWGSGPVPLYITSNPLIARAYARMILGYLRDLAASGDVDRKAPVYVVELGAGCGRFSFYLRRALDQMLSRSVFQDIRLVLIMTDFAEGNLDHWQRRSEFVPWLKTGALDVALFDLESSETLSPRAGNVTLAAGQQANPMIFIANYVFDAVPQDVFCSSNSVLQEFLISESESQAGKFLFDRRPVHTQRYNDPRLNDLLASFRDTDAKSVSMPVAAIQGIKHLRALAGGRMLLLSADKGYGPATMQRNAALPVIAQHGSASMMVNYGAIGRWVQNQNGEAWHPATPPTGLYVAAFAFGLSTSDEFACAYGDAINHGGPDDVCALKLMAAASTNDIPWDQALGAIRLAGFDSELLPPLLPSLKSQIATATPAQIADLAAVAKQIDEGYFPIGEAYDLAFDLGGLLLQAELFSAAAGQFKQSLDRYGPDASGFVNLALCHYRLGNHAEASQALSQGLQCDPANQMGSLLRRHLQQAMAA